MVKDHLVSAYAEPEYTIGVGGSGGAIQQHVYGQNHEGLLEGGVPQYSYSDMVTQTIHVGDGELLERWLDSKKITGEQFLDLNANVGSWEEPADMVREGCPYVLTACPAQIDVWSSRGMNLSPDGGATPAARREGDRAAQHAAYRSGMVFRGKLDIPVIDWRHSLEHRLDMHHTH